MNRIKLILALVVCLLSAGSIYSSNNSQAISLFRQLQTGAENGRETFATLTYHLFYDEPLIPVVRHQSRMTTVKQEEESVAKPGEVLDQSVLSSEWQAATTQLAVGNSQVLGSSIVVRNAQQPVTEISEQYIDQLILFNLENIISQGWLKGERGSKGSRGSQGIQGVSYGSDPATSLIGASFDVSGNGNIGADLSVIGNSSIAGNLNVMGTITGNLVGSVNAGFTVGSIPFQGANGLSENNTNLFWDNTNNRLGIGTLVPSHKLSVAAADADSNVPAFSVTRTISGISPTPLITALLRNTSDIVGGSDYQNEVHLRLQAGTTTDHRRYINFARHDGVDDWLTGVNASNRWILYDANSILHRMVMNTVETGGQTYLRSGGSSAVSINETASGESDAGTGGLEVWSGGAHSTRRRNHTFTSQGYEYYPDAVRRFYIDVNGSVNIVASAGSLIKAQNTSATKFDISNNGEFGFNTSVSSTPQAQFQFSTTNSPVSAYSGISSNYTYAPTADNASNIYGIQSAISSSTANRARVNGFFASVTGTNTGASSEQNGFNASVIYSGIGTMASQSGLRVALNNTNASGTVSDMRGVLIGSPTNAGSVGNIYGVRIENQNIGTITSSSWGVYQVGLNDKNYFSGTVGIGTTVPTAKLHVVGTGSFSGSGVSALNLSAHTATLTASPFTFRASEIGAMTLAAASAQTVTTASSLYIATPVAGSNVTITNNKPIDTQTTAYLSSGGTWTNASSRELKENFTALDPQEVLDKIDSLNIERWNYKAENSTITHIAPVAEEFYAAFNTGGIEGDKTISTIDPAGVALLGIQGLSAKLKSLLDMSWIIDGLKQFGIEITESLVRIKSLAIGSAEDPSGFVMYDKATKEAYCVEIENGDFIKTPGECDDKSEQAESPASLIEEPISEPEQTGETISVEESIEE